MPSQTGAPFGSVVFVRRDDRWTARMVNSIETAVAGFVTSDGSAAFLVTQQQIEGPGTEYTVVRSDDGLKSATCTTLPFPDELNAGGYAMETLVGPRLELRPSGRGRLVAWAQIGTADGSSQVTWWSYTTLDGGRTWSEPHRLRREPRRRRHRVETLHEPTTKQIASSLREQGATPRH